MAPPAPKDGYSFYRELIGRVAALDPTNDEDRRILADPALAAGFADVMALVANLLSTEDWSPEQAHPGFLVRRDGETALVAPYHLAAGLPTGDALADLRSIAGSIRTSGESAMCLSGSALTLAGPEFINDLDFCEYVPRDRREGALGNLSAAALTDRTREACIEIKIRGEKLTRPWADCSKAALMVLDQAEGASGPTKADFAVSRPTTGPAEATVMIVWVSREDPDGDAVEASFPFQEADLAAADRAPWIPRRLDRPESAGQYVRFLLREIEKYRNDRPSKALKRALSLAMYLLLRERQDAILKLVHASPAVRDEVLAERRAVVAKLRASSDPALAGLADRMQAELEQWAGSRTVECDQSSRDAFIKKAHVLVDAVLADVAAYRR